MRCTSTAPGWNLTRVQRQVITRCVIASVWPSRPPPTPPALAPLSTRAQSASSQTRPCVVPSDRIAASSNATSTSAGGQQAHQQHLKQQDDQQQQPQQPAVRLRVHRIGGDGACMFRAIVQGLHVAKHGNPMTPDSEDLAAQNLRLRVVQELRNRREEMEPFLPGIASDFDEYCRTMSHPMAWGGEPEMVMAVHVIQRPITVYHIQNGSLDPIVTYGDHLLPAVQPVQLLWSGAHYDLLVASPV